MIFGDSPSAGECLTDIVPASYPVASIIVAASSNVLNQNETVENFLDALESDDVKVEGSKSKLRATPRPTTPIRNGKQVEKSVREKVERIRKIG